MTTTMNHSTATMTPSLPTWAGPAWQTKASETNAGIRWSRCATTTVTTDADEPALPGSPANVEAAVYDFLTTIGPSVLVERQPVQVFVNGIVLDLDGARDLIAALTELVEAVEEGTP